LAYPSQQHQLARTQPSTQYIPYILPTFGILIEDDEPEEDSKDRIRISQQQPPPPLDHTTREILEPEIASLLDPTVQQEGIPHFVPQDIYSKDYKWDPAELVKLPDDDPYEKHPPIYTYGDWSEPKPAKQSEWTSDTVFMRTREKTGKKKKQDIQKKKKPCTKYDDMLQMEMASIEATVLKVQEYQEAVSQMEEQTEQKKTEGIGRRSLNIQFDRGLIAKLATEEAHLDLERRRIEHHMASLYKVTTMMQGNILHEKSICSIKRTPMREQTKLMALYEEKYRYESKLYDLQQEHKKVILEKRCITKELDDKMELLQKKIKHLKGLSSTPKLTLEQVRIRREEKDRQGFYLDRLEKLANKPDPRLPDISHIPRCLKLQGRMQN